MILNWTIGFFLWTEGRALEIANWARRHANRLLPFLALHLVCGAATILRITAAAALVSIPLVPAVIVWGAL